MIVLDAFGRRESLLVTAWYVHSLLAAVWAEQYCAGDPDGGCTTNMPTSGYADPDRCDHLAGRAPDPDVEPQEWQPVQDRDVIVFSAYLERRPKVGGPAIRIIAAGLQAAYNVIGDIHCLLWYRTVEGHGQAVNQRARYIRIYPSTRFPDMWVSHFVLCPIGAFRADSYTPYAVSVVPDRCGSPQNALLVANRRLIQKRDAFALCLPPVYLRFGDWRAVVEQIELHRMLGASAVTIYNQSMSAELSHVLRRYDGDPESGVRVVQWHFPSDRIRNSVHCQRAAVNDCLYRMSATHRYVAVNDLDEVLVPRSAATWPQMMADVADRKFGVYMFQHVYFRRNDTGRRPYLITQQSLWRTDRVVPPGKIRCKSMYDTDLILMADLHHHYELLPEAEEFMLPPDVGLLHHYRATPMSSFEKNPERYTYVENGYMLKYGTELERRVTETISRMDMG